MTVLPLRGFDGRFTSTPPSEPRCTLDQAQALYDTYMAAVCQHQGLRPREVARQLARAGKPNFDIDWRRAVYARQLVVYLVNTTHNVPQILLAQITGMTPAAICLALQAIEEAREVSEFDRAVDMVAAEMSVQL